MWRAETKESGAHAIPAPPSELRDEPSQPHKTPTTDPSSSIASSLQALAEREPSADPPLTLQPLEPEDRVVDGGVLARGATLWRSLPPGPLRDAVVSVEYLVHRGDYAGAVTAAARTFNDMARAGDAVGGTVANEGPALYALMLGLAGDRYLRLRETAARAAAGGASSADALFAIFFLVDVALRTK